MWHYIQSSWRPALEILILAVAIYYTSRFLRGTRGWPVVIGFIVLLLVLAFAATVLDLLELPGVGRKTANVVLGNAFQIDEGVVVDTHVSRLSQRLKLTRQKDPVKIEKDLMTLVPRKDWIIFSHLLIFHGRRVCKARRPLCEECVVEKLCPSSMLKTGKIPE